jgi:very-short-patch-repair endonuclease
MRKLLTKSNSTKAERVFAERLKALHIPFQHRVKINKKEIDFLIGRYAIEINGHEQNTDKNEMLARLGYIPLHISNKNVSKVNLSYLKCQI